VEIRRQPVQARTRDGWTLRGELIRPAPPSTAEACAVLGHAMMVDRRTMDRPSGEGLASTLGRAGIATLSFDLRGHGESGPTVREGGTWTYDDIVREDVPATVAEARRRFADRVVVVVGHSLFGHAAMIAAGLAPTDGPDAVVGLAPNLWAPRFEPSARRKIVKGASLLGWAALTAAAGRFEPRWLRMGTVAEPWPYVKQFLDFYFTNELRSADGRDDYVDALRRVELPILAYSSQGDTLLARPAAVARWLGEMRRAHVTHRVIDDQAISPPPDHAGLVTDARSRPVWNEIATFILGLQRTQAR
jgi:predicted alpha/beta hydrolase